MQNRETHKRAHRKLYIIGNGFDIHHGLKTGYADFHKWLQQQKGYSSVEEMERFFAVEEVVVLGLSFSDADRKYFAHFKESIPNTTKWKVSWFSESDRENIKSVLCGIDFAFIRMEDLRGNQNLMEVDDL